MINLNQIRRADVAKAVEVESPLFSRHKKLISVISLCSIFYSQVFPAYSQVPLLVAYEDTQNRYTPTEFLHDSQSEVSGVSSENVEAEDASQNFLSHQLVLEPVNASLDQRKETKDQNYVTEIYRTAAAGIHEIQPGTPVAYVAHHLTREDLRVLREQPEEIGLLIAGDLVVVYSTGHQEFISNIQPIRELIQSPLVRLSAHFHKKGPPSEADLHEEAGVQYVITTTSQGGEIVWVHEGSRIKDSMTYDEFIRYAENLRIRSDVDPVEIRRFLHHYIAAIDNYRETINGIPPLRPILFAQEGSDTVLPGKPFLGIFESHAAIQDNDFLQSSSREVRFNYDVRPAESFAALSIQFDNLGTSPIETQDLTGFSQITFGISSNNTCLSNTAQFCLKIEFEDRFGSKATFGLLGVSVTHQHFTILGSDINRFFPAFRLDQVRFINFVYDQNLTQPATRTGYLELTTGGLFFIPSLPPDPSLTPGDITKLPRTSQGARPELTGFAREDGSAAQITVFSPTFARLRYTGAQSDSFGGAFLLYDHPGTSQKESIDLTALFPQGIIISLDHNGSGTGEVFFEVTDAEGRKDSVQLIQLQAFGQRWKIVPSLFDEVDLTQITTLSFVFLGAGSRELSIDWGDFHFIPSLPPDPSLTPGDISLFSDIKHLVKFESDLSHSDGTVSLVQLSKTRFDLIYDLTQEDAFGGSITSFDDFGTSAKETKDFQNQALVFGLRDRGAPVVILQLEDADGKKDRVFLTGVDSTERFWAVSTLLFDEIDLSRITGIIFLLEEDQLTDPTSTLEVRLGNHPFVPILRGNVFDEDALTTLNNEPELSALGGNAVAGQPDGRIELTQLSSIEFEYEYDLTPSPSSFVVTNITRGSAVLNLPENLVLAARGREGGQARVEITDTNGLKTVFILNLRPIYQNYTLALSSDNVPTGFNRHSVQTITFIEDRMLAAPVLNDLVKVKIKGVKFTAPLLPDSLLEVRNRLIRDGLSYFHPGVGIDPATGFPRDHVNGVETAAFTQPTLIGFLLQIRGDQVNGKMDREGQTVFQLLSQIDNVMTNLLSVQADFGWNGLLPFFNLDPLEPMTTKIGLGDNANLAQSLAVLIGSLENAVLTEAERAAADEIIRKIEEFLNNQAAGYVAFVDPVFGIFRAAYDTATGQFDSYIDRLANEFRGAIAFLKVRYPILPDTIWTKLVPVFRDYTDQGGNTVRNLAPFDGGAFQMFWPILKNKERDFIGFRNALFNHLVTQTDFSSRFLIPGFLSASQRPTNTTEGSYYGRIGILEIAESNVSHLKEFLLDVGSTYALASAMTVDTILLVLGWLNAIEDQLPALMEGLHGFYDAARSNAEIARIFLGINIGSTILGLVNAGAEAFEAYLRNRGLELSYNLLYDNASRLLNIPKAISAIAGPPTFADDSLAVFARFTSEGVVNNFPATPTTFTGVEFKYGVLEGGLGGQFWDIPVHEVQANRFVLMYSITDSPGEIKVEFKDALDNSLFQMVVDLVDTPGFHTLIIDLPNLEALEAVAKVFVVIDQNATGDTSGDFFIHVMNFQHPPGRHHSTPEIRGTRDFTVRIPSGSHVNLLNYSLLQRLVLKGSFMLVNHSPLVAMKSFQTASLVMSHPTPLFWSTATLVKRLARRAQTRTRINPLRSPNFQQRFTKKNEKRSGHSPRLALGRISTGS